MKRRHSRHHSGRGVPAGPHGELDRCDPPRFLDIAGRAADLGAVDRAEVGHCSPAFEKTSRAANDGREISRSALMSVVRTHPVLSFFLLAYGLSWAYWIPLAIAGV